jgi:hypothetical protein
LGYSGPLLVTAAYAYYQDWLSNVMPSAYTPVVLLALGGLLIGLGAWIGPETKDVDFSSNEVPAATRREQLGSSRAAATPARGRLVPGASA